MRKIIRLGALAMMLALSGSSYAQKKKATNDNVVRIESGLVKGFSQEGTQAFLGIPYAKVERFMPPLPVDRWDAVMVCDHWGPMTMQNMGERDVPESVMSENCCVLNVWRYSKLSFFNVEETCWWFSSAASRLLSDLHRYSLAAIR